MANVAVVRYPGITVLHYQVKPKLTKLLITNVPKNRIIQSGEIIKSYNVVFWYMINDKKTIITIFIQ